MDALSVGHGLLWIVVLVQSIALLALTRQVGLLHERLPRVGALMTGRGPAVGETVPRIAATDLAGEPFELAEPDPSGRRRLLFFVSERCPVCKGILPWIESFARREALELVLVGDGSRASQERLVGEFGLEAVRFVVSPEIGMTLEVGKLPYAVLLGGDVVLARGLVNSREHLESLVVSAETGHGSLQDYLRAERNGSESHAA